MTSESPTLFSLDDARQLQAALKGNERIAIDTEFMRESTYFSLLCLIQIANQSRIYCIDPLDGEPSNSKTDSWRQLLDVPWVLHSGRQDIEVVFQAANAMPASVFDTQVAAGLLGMQPQIGYANLVAELFGVQLAKSQTRADWSRRPLSDDMLSYAAEDVLYLLPAADKLMQQLDELGRLPWAMQDCADLLQPSLYDLDTSGAVSRLKGARNLRGPARNIAVRLARWREDEAIQRDRPRQWILKDKVLLDIACRQPATRDALLAIPGMPERTAHRAQQPLLAAVSEGRDDSEPYEPPKRPDENQKALFKKVQARVSAAAEKLGIASEIIAPKKDLSAAVLGDFDGRVFRGWRAELIGNELREMLRAD